MVRSYLIHFFEDWEDFRLPEFKAVLRMAGADPGQVLADVPADLFTLKNKQRKEQQHFMVVTLPNEELIRGLCARSILVKAVYELWGRGDTFLDMLAAVKQSPLPAEHRALAQTWSLKVDSFNKKLTPDQKGFCRQHLAFLELPGAVELSHPATDLWAVLDFTRESQMPLPTDTSAADIAALQIPCYLGRLIARGGMRAALQKYDLKKRLYLGPTSLDDSLAFIMANLCGVQAGHLTYDPFVGTASILVANAHFGAMCFGSDIDPRVLRGDMYAGANRGADGKKRDIFENFRAYGLPLPELIRMDNGSFDRHMRFNKDVGLMHSKDPAASEGSVACVDSEGQYEGPDFGIFDAIVTDPPYGIRAGARKSGKAQPVDYKLTAEQRARHVPVTQLYAVEEVMLDLLHTAARSLTRGGVLSYLIPTTYDFTAQDLPVHPCLRLVEVCHQPLSVRHGRRAVVMRKTCTYTAARQAEYAAYKASVMAHSDGGFGLLMGKLEAALASDALENSDVVKQMSNRCKIRKEERARKIKARLEGTATYPPKLGTDRQKRLRSTSGFSENTAAQGESSTSQDEVAREAVAEEN